MDMLEFVKRFGMAPPTGTLVKAERLSLAPDSDKENSVRLTFSCGKTMQFNIFGGFMVIDGNATVGQVHWVKWMPQVPPL